MSLHSPRCTATVSPFETVMQCEDIRSVDEMILVCGNVAKALEQASFAENDVFSIRLALEECIANSLKHGHGGDLSKTVHIRYSVTDEAFEAEIEDEGPGFDPNTVPDPLAPENLEKPSGRGIFLMRHYMHTVEYNVRGNCVRLRRLKKPIQQVDR